jgi:hypothetical protein
MRDFRDAKVMAHALRDALKTKAVETTHSESLELIAKAFGYENWNILSAKINAAEPRQGANHKRSSPHAEQAAEQKTLYCSFCGKSQHDVRRLVAGPAVCICDKCVGLALDFVEDLKDEDLLLLMQGDADRSRIMSTEELAHYLERGRLGVDRNRLILDAITQKLAMREGETTRPGDLLAAARFNYLKNKTREELVVLQQSTQQRLERYEDVLRIATTALGSRRH